MYNLSNFNKEDKQVILQFLYDHPFAFLPGNFTKGKDVATQIPMLVEEREGKLILPGHIMRMTDPLNIIDKFEKQGGDAAWVAAEMKIRKEQLFPPGVEWDNTKFLS